MIKRTVYIGNPARIYHENLQIKIVREEGSPPGSVPVEDIGMLILDHPQISITHRVIQALQENETVIISCDQKHMPSALMVPFEGHHVQAERMRIQMNASVPLTKQLWKQTIESKIRNQAKCLEMFNKENQTLLILGAGVKSGDPDNKEGRAAKVYWSTLFEDGFARSRYGDPPNAHLNYSYAILRSVIARALVGSGMNLSMGIHHHNRYNVFCLADDIMEPYRPFADKVVYEMYCQGLTKTEELTPSHKKLLLSIPAMDVMMDGEKSPLLVAAGRTSSTLFECFSGKRKKILYPDFL